jgi:hypothetical protein
MGWQEVCFITAMRFKTFLVIIITALSFQAKAFDVVDFSEQDKDMHAGLSYNLTAAATATLKKNGYSSWKSALISGSMVFLVGVLKEYALDNSPDTKDVQADLAGTAVGMTIPFRVEF